MPDIASIAAAFSAVNNATSILKAIRDGGSSLEKAEASLKLADLTGALAEIKMQIADLKVDIISKDEEIRALKAASDENARIFFEAPAYWKQDGERVDGPFCQRCRDSEAKLIRLYSVGSGHWQCKVCDSSFFEKSIDKSAPTRALTDYSIYGTR